MGKIIRINGKIVNTVGFKTENCMVVEPGDEFTDEDLAKIQRIRVFIEKTMDRSVNYNQRITSNALKRDCSEALEEYVSNGELIVALYMEGYRVKPVVKGNKHAKINFNYAKYKQQIKRLYPDLAWQYGWI